MSERPGDGPGDRPGDRTDAELLAAHVAGDHEAFGELVARHRDRLWAVALRTTGNREDAADGLQDGLVAAYRRAGSFRGDAAVTTWLHRVVVNACLDRLRAARVRRAEALPDDLEEYGDRGSRASSGPDVEDPAETSVRGEQRREVLAALATLPPEQRAALVLVDMEGYAVAEAAAILGCAPGTVKSRCSRGRARLAVLLGVDRPGHPQQPERGVRAGVSKGVSKVIGVRPRSPRGNRTVAPPVPPGSDLTGSSAARPDRASPLDTTHETPHETPGGGAP